MNTAQDHRSTAFLFSPGLDFLLAGGVTLVLIPFIALLTYLQVDIAAVGVAVFYFAFLINNPHFMHSYQLLYDGFLTKLRQPQLGIMSRLRLLMAGVVVPVVLAAYLALAFLGNSRELMSYALNAMFFFVGWHYVKQGYGVLVTFSARQGHFLKGREKQIVLAHAYISWLTAWALANTKTSSIEFNEIPFYSLQFPELVPVLMLILTLISGAMALKILLARFNQGTLSGIGLTGYACALYPWTLLASINQYSLLIIPALHSLQYLLFVWKLEREKTAEETTETSVRPTLWFYVVGYSSGVLFFFLIPLLLDQHIKYDTYTLGSSVFMFMFLVFINIHHYFIDFAIWRKDNPDMKYLLR